MIGRGLRTAPGKDDCLILDHSDNHARLGFVTDIHHDQLDDGKERRASQSIAEEPLPKKCPKCSFLRPPKVLQCPCCGFIPVPRSNTVHRDGELVELGARDPVELEHDRVRFFQELRAVALMRGYKDGWTAHKFKDKFGHFPSRNYVPLQPRAPSDATLRWVQSRQIAFAKSRRVAA
jgi:superfamily II DNA or RNA helicase